MTDQTIPADKVREIIARHRDGASHRGGMILNDLKALLPLPTLADMTADERSACRWMQCDYAGVTSDSHGRGVIGYFDFGEKKAIILTPACGIARRDYARVTPRPDLPRMEWPGDKKPDPAPAPALPEGWRLADHPAYGRVVVTNPTPDVGGHVYFVSRAPSPIGNDWHFCTPAELTYIDQESPATARVGDTIKSADDPRIDSLPTGSVLRDLDGDDVEKTTTGEWDAEGITIESPGCGPWTVHRIGGSMTTIDRAAEIIRLAMLSPTFRSPEIRALTAARALRSAGLLMPDGMSTQTETVGTWEAVDAVD